MRCLLFGLLAIIFINKNFAQNNNSPYEWKWGRDAVWTGAAIGLTATGLMIIKDKEEFTEDEIIELMANKDNINFFDRWAAGNYDPKASDISDIPFFISFAAPFALLFEDDVNDNMGTVLGMYIESLATTSALFTLSAGLTNRARPYVYSDETPLARKQRVSATRSFYSGHVAAVATATFFTAKVYQDFNPGSPAVPFMWVGAATLPAAVAYLRMEAGQHFPTDVLLGYGMGALVGIVVPELHKKKNQDFSVDPVGGFDVKGQQFHGLALKFAF